MNNKYSVACITLVRDKYKIITDGMVLRLAWYIRLIRFENLIRNRIGRPIRDLIRTQKKQFAGPQSKTTTKTEVANILCINVLKRGRCNVKPQFKQYVATNTSNKLHVLVLGEMLSKCPKPAMTWDGSHTLHCIKSPHEGSEVLRTRPSKHFPWLALGYTT